MAKKKKNTKHKTKNKKTKKQKKPEEKAGADKDAEKVEFSYTGVATLEHSKEIPQKVKRRLPYNAPIWYLPQNAKTLVQRDTCTPIF